MRFPLHCLYVGLHMVKSEEKKKKIPYYEKMIRLYPFESKKKCILKTDYIVPL